MGCLRPGGALENAPSVWHVCTMVYLDLAVGCLSGSVVHVLVSSEQIECCMCCLVMFCMGKVGDGQVFSRSSVSLVLGTS